ncbi:Protein of unknown function [Cotesia congregata]|uniref:Uncharacterized protein n=1 Tax=Cotesia congregata TaxID=51543 RepID=A0A8J2MLI6_COTCN|nr:Protein of unknown function [Cotesia congregata]
MINYTLNKKYEAIIIKNTYTSFINSLAKNSTECHIQKKQKIYRWNSIESLNPFERFLGQCLAFVTFALIAIFIILSGLFLLGIFILLCLVVITFAVFIIISIGTIATIILGIIVNIIIAVKATLLIMALEMKSNYTKFDLIKNSQDATIWESITVIKSEKERIMWIWCIIIAYTIPELINSLLCFKKR